MPNQLSLKVSVKPGGYPMLQFNCPNLRVMSVSEALGTLVAVLCYSVDYVELFRSLCCVGKAILPIVVCISCDVSAT